ncbi:Maf family protein [Saccharothrix violaceirubra]|uniref:Nucleoside triphosphate pyrophosphatase n=1 Tax=Saccharothrix violaceirubra TaxID=413306 RepID=A0A7W7SYA1_9PSEU|nr:nucleoside triphosphate pyrophosphatase [Saccharothrix violaceirubra]MBB4963119.1 septum formation protein [Saccharothrix violaceirubra]
MRFVLASQSPARLAVLKAAGISPDVLVSGVDEDALVASLVDPTPQRIVEVLARAKAEAVDVVEGVVVGCDSMLLTADGRVHGKPKTREVAERRWREQAGTTATLLTGHAVIRKDADGVRTAVAHEATLVRFGTPTEAELQAYLDSGEPLEVAGAFTLDGRGGWFVDGIDGDHTSVIGISLPLTRRLLHSVGITLSDLW